MARRNVAIIRRVNGQVDDVAIHCGCIHLEQMDDTCWSLVVMRGRQEVCFSIWYDRKRRQVVAEVQHDNIGCTDDTPQA